MPHRFPPRRRPGLAPCLPSLLAGCARTEAPPEPVRAVKVITVGAPRCSAARSFAARCGRASNRAWASASAARSPAPGRGRPARAGRPLLAQLDPQDYRLAADAARAQVAAATTNRDLAAADFKRYVTLREQNFISGAELERRETR
jgi:hypothetical protein